MVSFPQVSQPEPCAHLSPPPYTPHAPPISFFSILPPAQYWVRNTDHEAFYVHKNVVGGGNDSFEGRDCHSALLALPATQCHIPELNPRLLSPSSTERTNGNAY